MQKLSKNRRHAVMGILAVAITGIVFSSILLINNPFNPGAAPGNTLEDRTGGETAADRVRRFPMPPLRQFRAEHPPSPGTRPHRDRNHPLRIPALSLPRTRILPTPPKRRSAPGTRGDSTSTTWSSTG